MLLRMIPIAAISVLMLAGCQESVNDTARDVSDARQDAAQNVSETRQDANQAINTAQRDVVDARRDVAVTDQNAAGNLRQSEAAAMTQTAHANFDVAEAEAEGRHDIAMERCDALEDAAKDLCVSNAEMELASAMATATSARDTRLLAAERHE